MKDDTSLDAQFPLSIRAKNEIALTRDQKFDDDDVIDASQIWRVILRYKHIIISLAIGFAVFALLYSLLLRPVYTSYAVVRVNSNTSIVDVGDEIMGGYDWKTIPTILRLLGGQSLGKAIVQDLNLQENPEFSGQLQQRNFLPSPGSFFKFVVSSVNKKNSSEALIKTPEQIDNASLSRAVGVYQSNVGSEEIESTDLIKVSYSSFDSALSAQIVNQIVDSFNRTETENQNELTEGAQKILENELEQVQRKLQLSEKKLTEFSRKTGIVDLEDQNNIMETRHRSISNEYIEAQNKRLGLEVKILNAKNTKDKLLLTSLLDSERVNSLLTELNALRIEYQKLASVFKPGYPKLKALQNTIAQVNSNIRKEVDNAVNAMIADYKVALDRENQLSEELNKSNHGMLDLKDRSIAFNILKRELESNKNLYEALLEKTKKTRLASNLELNKLSLVEAGQNGVKTSPNITKNVALSGAVGMFLGVGIAFLLALLDRQFRSIKEIEELANLPVLAIVPYIKKEKEIKGNHVALLSDEEPSGIIAETFRSLRTSLMYSMPGVELDSLMITSSGPSEGKSSSMVNLATTMANKGLSVVVVDLDLRKPSVHKVFGFPRAPGFTDTLVNRKATVRKTKVDNLYVIPAGTSSPNPTEMLESNGCRHFIQKLREKFDVVIFDTPPVMGLADALIISQFVKVCVVAVDMAQTNKDALKSSLARLRRVNAPIAGVLVTRHSSTQTEDYGYNNSNYHYYHYNYSDLGFDDVDDAPKNGNGLAKLIKKGKGDSS